MRAGDVRRMRQVFQHAAVRLLGTMFKAALTRADQAVDLLLQKSLQSARASAFYSYLCGGLSVAGTVGAWFYMHVPFLIWFTAGCSVVFILSGIWYSWIARKQNPRQ